MFHTYLPLDAVRRFKNRYLYPTFNGYRDGLFNLRVKLPNGRYHIVELQIHLLDIIKFKAATHKYYGTTHFALSLDLSALMGIITIIVTDVMHAHFSSMSCAEYFRSYFAGNLDVVGERMELLESIAGTGGQSLESIVNNALESGDKGRLLSISDLLDKMSELELLQTVKEKLADLAKDAHGADSAEHATALNNLALTLEKQVRFFVHFPP
jgi:hypothetical protein